MLTSSPLEGPRFLIHSLQHRNQRERIVSIRRDLRVLRGNILTFA